MKAAIIKKIFQFISYLLLALTLLPLNTVYSGTDSQPAAGKIISIQGDLDYSEDGGKSWSPAVIGQLLYEGGILRTGEYGKAAILLSDETQMKLHSKSRILLKSVQSYEPKPSGITSLYLSKGQAWFRAKRPDTKFDIRTPISFAGIRGTEINVSMNEEKEEAAVTVVEGSVEYSNDAGSVILYDGDQGIIRKGEAPQKVTLVNPDDAVQWSLYYMGVTSYRDYPFISANTDILTQKLSETPLAKIEEAQIYHDLGNMEKAEEILKGLPSNDEVNTLWGWIFLEKGDIDNALLYFEKIKKDNIYVILGKSKAYYVKDNIKTAIDIILNERYDNSPELLTQLGYLYLSRGFIEEAKNYLEKTVDIDPQYGLAYGFLSNIYIVTNKVDYAMDYAKKALDASPYSPSAHVDMSYADQALFDLDSAKEYAKKAVDLDPTNSFTLYQYAKLLFGFGYNKEAEQVITKALQYNPEDSLLNSLYGFILFSQAKTAESIEIFKKAIQLDSTQGSPRLGLGLAYFRNKNYPEGIEEMLIATLLESKVSLFQSYLGKSYYQAKRFTEAEMALDYAKKLDPNDPTPYLYGGNMKRDLYRYDEAASDIQKSIELNDNRAVYRSRLLLDKDKATRSISLAKAYSDLGIYAKAFKEAIISLESDITNGSAHLFFAESILMDPVRVAAAGSELFMAYFLMPVNQNVFNSFNDYTSMLEVPYNRLTLRGRIGQDNFVSEFVDLQGGSDRYAYYAKLQYTTGLGLFTNSDAYEKIKVGYFLGKFLVNESSDLFISYGPANLKSKFSTPLADFFYYDIDTKNRFEGHQLHTAYHKNINPGSDLLVLLEFYYYKTIYHDEYINDFEDFVILKQDEFFDYNLQISHILDLDENQLQYGLGYFLRDQARTNKAKDRLYPISVSSKVKADDHFFNIYLNDIYSVNDKLDLTIGAEFKYINEGNVSLEDDFSNLIPEYKKKQFNPQIGFKYRLSDKTLIRGAAFRTLQDTIRVDLGPTQISGFVVPGGTGTTVTTDKKEYDIGIEHDFNETTFGFIDLQYRDADTPYLKDINPGMESAELKQLNAGFEKIVNKYISFGLYYLYDNVNVPLYDRQDQDFQLSLTLNFGQGWKINLYETYTDIHFTDVNEYYDFIYKSDYFWLTTINIYKEFPDKMGAFNLNLYNIFDQEFYEPRYPGDVVSIYKSEFYWEASLEFRF